MNNGNGFLFERIEAAIQMTGQSDEYFRGMCNGMRFVKALIDGKEPEYFGYFGAEPTCDAAPDKPEGVSAGRVRIVRGEIPEAAIIGAERLNELAAAAEPLRAYLKKYGDPMTVVVVRQDSATEAREEGYVTFKFKENSEEAERELRQLVAEFGNGATG